MAGSLALFKLYNGNERTKEWSVLNINQILSSRQTPFMTCKSNRCSIRHLSSLRLPGVLLLEYWQAISDSGRSISYSVGLIYPQLLLIFVISKLILIFVIRKNRTSTGIRTWDLSLFLYLILKHDCSTNTTGLNFHLWLVNLPGAKFPWSHHMSIQMDLFSSWS